MKEKACVPSGCERKETVCTTPPAVRAWNVALGFLLVSIGMAGCDTGNSLPPDPEPGAKMPLSGVYNLRDLG
ncbi:MAG: hypothetical protein LBR96_04555, partial [Treponema sp.]|nr:hypothetical protein [Treponema sp.]